MTVGSEEVVDHQRLSGAGYCFSASAPPFLSKVCLASVRRLEGRLDEMITENAEWIEEEDIDRVEGDGDAAIVTDELNVTGMKVADLKIELKKRGLGVSGRKAELQERLNDYLSSSADKEDSSPSNPSDEISGTTLIERLHQNISHLYTTLTNSAHPHALKLRNRLIITSHPQSPILYLCLADQEATGRTRAEQTSILDQISAHCLIEGKVAVVSTGDHVKKYLQLVPEPSLRLIANVSQTKDDVELLVRVLGDAVESVLVRNAGILME